MSTPRRVADGHSLFGLQGRGGGDPVGFRLRAQIEERFKDTKPGMPLRPLPSGYYNTNRVWMWSAFLAVNLFVFMQRLGQVDNHHREPKLTLEPSLWCLF